MEDPRIINVLNDPLMTQSCPTTKFSVIKTNKGDPQWVINSGDQEFILQKSKMMTKNKKIYSQTLRCSIRKNRQRAACNGTGCLKFLKSGMVHI